MSPTPKHPLGPGILEQARVISEEATAATARTERSKLGQFFTPPAVAALMASSVTRWPTRVRLMDPGAGSGVLFAAAIADALARSPRPKSISVTAFEIDAGLHRFLQRTGEVCASACAARGVEYHFELVGEDFLAAAVQRRHAPERFTTAILNPPYAKIRSDTVARALSRELGVETTNLYTAFVAAALQLLGKRGELVSITPRSFCNGVYFRPFRKLFFDEMALRRVHLFDSRTDTFGGEVLQESVILASTKGLRQPASVQVSVGDREATTVARSVPFVEVVRPTDADKVIHIASTALAADVARSVRSAGSTVAELGLTVSTGRVVDFRARSALRGSSGPKTVPLLYPVNLVNGRVQWPVETKKAQAIVRSRTTESLCVPNEHYVLVKRFSAKEERRRIVAAVYDASSIDADVIGIENHINYLHRAGRGIDIELTRGLATYLNSTLVDAAFRQFSGHTQVNAADLRSMPYPPADILRAIGVSVASKTLSQSEIDQLVEATVSSEETSRRPSAISAARRIEESQSIARALAGRLPAFRERVALDLLALADVTPARSWGDARGPVRTMVEIKTFVRRHYGTELDNGDHADPALEFLVTQGLALRRRSAEAYLLTEGTVHAIRSFGTPGWDALTSRPDPRPLKKSTT